MQDQKQENLDRKQPKIKVLLKIGVLEKNFKKVKENFVHEKRYKKDI